MDWKGLLKYALGFAILGYVVWANWADRVDPRALAQAVASANAAAVLGTPEPEPYAPSPGLRAVLSRPMSPLYLALTAAVTALAVALTFVRWHGLVRAQGLPFTLRNAFRLGLVGYYFNTFLPGSVGGDVLKAVAISRGQSRRTVAVATVLIDRAVGLWGLLWCVGGLGGLFWLLGDPALQNAEMQALVRRAIVVLAVTVAVWLGLGFLPERRAERFAGRLAWLPKVGNSLAELWRAVWLYRRTPRAIAAALGLSAIGHAGFVLSFHFAARVFPSADAGQGAAGLAEHFLIVPVGMVVQALFPTPGGVGGGEAAYGWLYSSLLGKAAVVGVLACLAQRVVTLGLGLGGYLVYLRMKAELPASEPEGRDAPAAA